MPLQKHNLDSVVGFLRSPAWPDLRQCAETLGKARSPMITDTPDIAAAISHQRYGFEAALAAIEESVRGTPIDPNAPAQSNGTPPPNIGGQSVSPILQRIADDAGVSVAEVQRSIQED